MRGRRVVWCGLVLGLIAAGGWVAVGKSTRPDDDLDVTAPPAERAHRTGLRGGGRAVTQRPDETSEFVDGAEALKILSTTKGWELHNYLQRGLHKPFPHDLEIVQRLLTLLDEDAGATAISGLLQRHLTSMPVSFLPQMRTLLESEAPKVRWHGIQLLVQWRQMKRSLDVPEMRALVDDEDPSVRQAAMTLLAWGMPFDPDVRDRLVQMIVEGGAAGEESLRDPVGAARGLAVMEDPAFDSLLDLMRTVDPDRLCLLFGALRYAARERIARAVPQIRGSLSHQDAAVCRVAMAPLRALGADARPALPELIVLLEGENEVVARDALALVGAIGEEARRATPAVIALLRNPNERVAEAAAATLGRIAAGHAGARQALLALIHDEASDEAAKALASFGAEGLADAVAVIRTDDAHSRYAALLTVALQGAKAASAVPLLIPLIDQEEDRLLRQRAIGTAGHIGAQAAATVPAIMRALASREMPLHAKVASDALLRMVRAAEPALRDALTSKDGQARRQAALVLSRWGPRARFALTELASILGDESVDARRAAITAIVDSFDGVTTGGGTPAPAAYLERASQALARAKEDKDERVRASALYGGEILSAVRGQALR